LNVLCGTAALSSAVGVPGGAFALAAAAVWTVYIAFVTGYSAGEENDPAKKRKVGLLIGGIVYLQLIALMISALIDSRTVLLLAAGGALLVLLRIARRMLPGVSAS
jgi:threonine/homoserine efflux transporter RhtA